MFLPSPSDAGFYRSLLSSEDIEGMVDAEEYLLPYKGMINNHTGLQNAATVHTHTHIFHTHTSHIYLTHTHHTYISLSHTHTHKQHTYTSHTSTHKSHTYTSHTNHTYTSHTHTHIIQLPLTHIVHVYLNTLTHHTYTCLYSTFYKQCCRGLHIHP